MLIMYFHGRTMHIKYICQKIVRNLYLLQQIKDFFSFHARKLFVSSFILPHFDYCSVVWGNCSASVLCDLEKLQKRAARMILDVKLDSGNTTPSQALFTQLNWMPLQKVQDRIRYHRAIQAFKYINGINEQGLSDIRIQ